MIILPTHKRLHNLARFIAAYYVTEATEPVLLVIDEDDHTYDTLLKRLPNGFGVLRIPPGSGAAKRVNLAYDAYPNESYYGLMADDVVPITKHWDAELKQAAGGWHIAYCADGIQNQRLATHPFIGGELVRSMGFIQVPEMLDWYGDNCLMDIGGALDLLRYLPNVQYDHRHYVIGKAMMDQTYAKQSKPRDAAEAYMKWREHGLEGLLEGIRDARV